MPFGRSRQSRTTALEFRLFLNSGYLFFQSYLVWALSIALAGILAWVHYKMPHWHSNVERFSIESDKNCAVPSGLHLLAIRFSLDEAGIWLTVVTALANLPIRMVSSMLVIVLGATAILGWIFRALPKLLWRSGFLGDLFGFIIAGGIGGLMYLFIPEGLLIAASLIALIVLTVACIILTLCLPLPWIIRGHRLGYGSEDLSESAFTSWTSRLWPEGENVTRARFSVLAAIEKTGIWRSLGALARGATPHGLVYQYPISLDTIVEWVRMRRADRRSKTFD